MANTTKFEQIKTRYQTYYVTEEQLDRYVELNVITTEQAVEIRASRV